MWKNDIEQCRKCDEYMRLEKIDRYLIEWKKNQDRMPLIIKT